MPKSALERLHAHLNDKSKYVYYCVRAPFITTNGLKLSLQQSREHHSDSTSLELGYVPDHPLITKYFDGDTLHNYVPIKVVAKYIETLESTGETA